MIEKATAETGEALIERLIERQRAFDWNDRQMARRLGVSQQLWHGVKNHYKRLGVKLAYGAKLAFPDLTHTVDNFLRLQPAVRAYFGDGKDVASTATRAGPFCGECRTPDEPHEPTRR